MELVSGSGIDVEFSWICLIREDKLFEFSELSDPGPGETTAGSLNHTCVSIYM